ncbi:hypothetical protein A3G55_01620 [Candidatus Giovannonibacteria bacterium RIFCSPLOWO2_12_FULL_44_25]|uniref:Uncharacterized protein n=3 Tax=Parcubacteria group TaxID=1794811 RepID=A0A837IGV7_9BACT|nr:MAG: hypothetical protein UW15_C0004G0009 [Parcubacteria group bacterium GW2011_GWC1_44_10]KKT60144.1 MAG: hypothetical protein UW53_C0003G0055 [Candidatus Giovannonibacteria bacterium GW2011_GWA1_44_25]KKU12644.1 MAG: hypothetical protein UX18_C0016G0007 [Candidatus Azambacteria bacterium GW2011_GWC2_45_7b]KKU29991.1 MAG: hypothetical protein UX43_C0003G0084 [Candidatus Giovannonibacteria bacterium GW2011_GWB1_46_20]OGF49349.1 MAG: hypothetical protein A2120_03455 [Candidatus Giovannonibact
MRAAFALSGASFKPNAGKLLIVEHIMLVCLAFSISFLISISDTANLQTMSVFEKFFVFLAGAFLSYILLAFLVTPIGWISLLYCSEQKGEQKSAK